MVDYVRGDQKVTITCARHGPFEQTAANHLNGAGCPYCARETASDNKRLSKESFVERATVLYGDRYSYEKCEITSAKEKGTVVCPLHGDFMVSPTAHLRGVGCPNCSRERLSQLHRMSTEEFLDRCKTTHGEKYNYDSVVYVNKETKVEIECPEHGIFWQRAGSHMAGAGCSSCNEKLWDKDYWIRFPKTYLYVFQVLTPDLRFNFWKVGISKRPKNRASNLSKELDGALVEIRRCVYGDSEVLFSFEKELHRDDTLKNLYIGKQFGGFTECYRIQDIGTINSRIDNLLKTSEGVHQIC